MRFCWLLLFPFWLVPFFAHILFLIIIILLYSWMLVCPSSFLWLFCQFIIYASCYFELFFESIHELIPNTLLFCVILWLFYFTLDFCLYYLSDISLTNETYFLFFFVITNFVSLFFISCCAQVFHIYTILSIFFSRSCFIYTYALY